MHIAARRAVSFSDDIKILFTGRDVREIGPRRPHVDVYVVDSEAVLNPDDVTNRLPDGIPVLMIGDESEVSGLSVESIEQLLVPALRLTAAGYVVGRPVGDPDSGSRRDGYPHLTDRELDVLDILATGGSNRQIAEELSITENTVKYHLQELYRKLDVNSRSAAVMEAIRTGLVEI